MSEARDMMAFGEVLHKAFHAFQNAEELIRQQYASGIAAGTVPDGIDDEKLLERPTRRFLIDGILQGLDWNPDDPAQVAEEARGWGDNNERLYFDYLGIAPHTHTPIILIEAKGYDAPTARRPRGQNLTAIGMAEMISEALKDLKNGNPSRAILAEWAEWLRNLRDYVVSLGVSGQATLKRVVITSGRWLIVFEEPISAFITPGPTGVSTIHCFVDFDDIIKRSDTIFRLLQRQRLVNTLPLTMPVSEALGILAPQTISKIFRGVVVVTRDTGAAKKSYPTRSVYPSLIVLSSGRPFVIADYEDPVIEEPRGDGDFASFLNSLSSRGVTFEARLLAMLDRTDLQPLALGEFPGFRCRDEMRDNTTPMMNPLPDSTAAIRLQNSFQKRCLVTPTGESRGIAEFVVATGEHWFYKIETPVGPSCEFHAWPKAREAGVAASNPHVGNVPTSYTQSGQSQHCAHEQLRGMRGQRCHIDVLESHLCCKACIFYIDCWTQDADRLPCP